MERHNSNQFQTTGDCATAGEHFSWEAYQAMMAAQHKGKMMQAGACDRAPGEVTAITDAICEHLAILHKEIGDIEARFSAVLREPGPQKNQGQESRPVLTPLGDRLMNALYGIDTAVERLRMLQELAAL